MGQKLAKTELFAKWMGGNLVVADQSVSTGRRIWVDATTGTDAGGFGASPDAPVATIDYAVALCTDNKGDIIYVMPGHVESLGAAETIDFDVAGITVIGLGSGTDRPRIDYDATDAGVDVGANNVTLRNLTFRPSVSATLIGVDVEANFTNFTIEGCEWLVGEANTDEFVTCIDLKSANDDSVVHDNVFNTLIGDTHCVVCILLTAAMKRVRILGNYMYGNWSTAAIDDGAACTELLIEGNRMKVKDAEPGIELHNNTTGIIAHNLIESTGVTADNAIAAADCSWFDNWCVLADGLAAELIGTRVEVLGADAIANASIADGALSAGKIAGDAITNAKIADAAISEEHIDADAAQRMGMGIKVSRTAADVLDGTTTPLFTVAGGMVAVHGIVGIVSVAAADTGASNTQYSANPTTGTANALCAVTDLTDAEVGAMLSMTGEAATALIKASGGASMCTTPVCVNIGTIDIISGLDIGTGGAVVAFTLYYTPIDTGATVVAA